MLLAQRALALQPSAPPRRSLVRRGLASPLVRCAAAGDAEQDRCGIVVHGGGAASPASAAAPLLQPYAFLFPLFHSTSGQRSTETL